MDSILIANVIVGALIADVFAFAIFWIITR